MSPAAEADMFIDARNLGRLIKRRTKQFAEEDIQKIAEAYHNWRASSKKYKDEPGFCCVAKLDRVQALDFVLTPGRYVGLPEEEDDFDLAERFAGPEGGV